MTAIRTESVLAARREKEAAARKLADEAGLCRKCRKVPRVEGAVSCAKCLADDRKRQSDVSYDESEYKSGAREFWDARAEGRQALNPHLRESPEYRDFESGLREARIASEINARDANARRKPSRAGGRPRKG